ncbi:MAG: aldehyde dehydrogenase family protein, partial [Saprospiraceae bacterium]
MSTIQNYPQTRNFIGGKFVQQSKKTLDVITPLSGDVLSQVTLSDAGDLDIAVKAALAAFPTWAATPIKERVQVFYRYKTLLEKNMKELAQLVHEENGKTIEEATAEVEKSIELTEFACSLPQLISGELLEVSKGVECRVEHKPLGVVASIAPFNFPNMVPHWTIPNAIALGNCMILKPSEQVPISSNRISELLKEAGLPDGVFNVVNGDREIVEAICDHPDIQAVSFVGSTKVAKIVYRRSTGNLKRCVALGGAKNHLIVLP